ncbi:uncharacterized protein KY384_002782 [Bacidia gigantensis]|uniref:uncharacterized protein n=1 Tax=Bacidia gigantensis TaxID=2732470 RepID=UPI001D04FCEF|nr:uncharacterized protein KY384_002782 [Bacidia gigantensis]KAG8532904.1 hypothetical protein KY384_002782 [Bacidia gigantensis]
MAPLRSFTHAILALQALTSCVTSSAILQRRDQSSDPVEARNNKIAPKVFILNAFSPEAGSFYAAKEFNLLAQNITVPGISPRFPDAHCTANGEICQVTTGEGEINAAGTSAALVYSGLFDLKKTYFLIAGIAGIDPNVGSTGSVTFARFEIQVALQYEFDIREIGNNFSTGYIPYGAKEPLEYPSFIYGTEVFEVNDALRSKAITFAKTGALNDTDTAKKFRQQYKSPGNKPPSVIPCDGATSDVFYNGNILGTQFGKYASVITNGSALYCATAQEDTAIMSSLLRAAKAGLVCFDRIIAMRTAANFDRPPPGVSTYQNFFYGNSGGFGPSVANLAIAGVPVVEGIVKGWEKTFKGGVKATNYVGDIFGSLGGTPDFGPYPYFGEG